MDPAKDTVFGHEFCAEVLDTGPNTPAKFKPGTLVCAVPFNFGPEGPEIVGYSNIFPGGYSEQMVLTQDLCFEVPNGLPAEQAALTEPFAVGEHAVARSSVDKDSVPMVIGCGPVGISVIAALKARGLGPVIAADFSVRTRWSIRPNFLRTPAGPPWAFRRP
jgi:threonine dehydrogenase-like Zn-dependent dehydrogenase